MWPVTLLALLVTRMVISASTTTWPATQARHHCWYCWTVSHPKHTLLLTPLYHAHRPQHGHFCGTRHWTADAELPCHHPWGSLGLAATAPSIFILFLLSSLRHFYALRAEHWRRLSIYSLRAYTLEGREIINKQYSICIGLWCTSASLVTLARDSKSPAELWWNMWLFKLRSYQGSTCQEARRNTIYSPFAAWDNNVFFSTERWLWVLVWSFSSFSSF